MSDQKNITMENSNELNNDRDMMMMMSTTATSDNNDNDESCSGFLEWSIFIAAIIVGVIVFLLILRKIIQGPFYRKKNRIDGKVVIITGCNTGIGKETALDLASRGGKIYMACRDPVRCEGARLEIIEKTKNENVFNRTLDLGSLESVRKFAEKFIAEESRLDILINNAGIMAIPRRLTKDGYEQQFGVNHLGHFLLTNLLLDLIKSSAPSRIVVVTSAIYIFGRIKKNDLMREKSYTKFGAYSQSKLANILFTKKLSEKLHGTNVTVNCCHPGVVKTELSRHLIKGKLKSFLDIFMSYVMKSPKAGAQTTLRLALDPNLEKSSGGYYFDTIRCPLLPKARNKEMADWLWQVSEEMVGLSPKTQMLTIVSDATETDSSLATSAAAAAAATMMSANGNGIKIQQKMPESSDDNTTVIDVEQTPNTVETVATNDEMKKEDVKMEATVATKENEIEKMDEAESESDGKVSPQLNCPNKTENDFQSQNATKSMSEEANQNTMEKPNEKMSENSI